MFNQVEDTALFKITNTSKAGQRNFYNAANKLVVLGPGQTREFAAELLNSSILRPMIASNSTFAVEATTDRALAMLELAGKRKEKRTFEMAHSSAEASAADVFQRERASAVGAVEVRDFKTPRAAPVAPAAPAAPAALETTGPHFVKDPANPNLPPPDAPPPPAKPAEPSRKDLAAALLADLDGLPFADLQDKARALLGDDFPKGSAGRKSIRTALEGVN